MFSWGKIWKCGTAEVRFSIACLLFFSWMPAGILKAEDRNIKGSEGGKNLMQSNQILLQPSMLFDEASGNICYSAGYLIDEQSFTPDYDLHPVGQPWNPFKHTNKGQSIYIDLGQQCDLSGIAFYNLDLTEGLEISVGKPGDWKEVLQFSCDNPNDWAQSDINASTRYIRLTANSGSVISVNEMILYGNQQDNAADLKSGFVTDLEENSGKDFNWHKGNDIYINQNPVYDNLVLSLPEDPGHIFTVEIYNLNGLKVMRKEFIHNISSRLFIDLSKSCSQSGVYILHYYNNAGISRTLKFEKKN